MKIKFGSLVVAGSGKIGGHVAAKNRGGAYLRTKITPLNPNTAAQAGARSLLASLSTAWAGLTDAQRKSWNDGVANFATTDIFGDLRNPSGINLYVKLNANAFVAGHPALVTCPAKIEVPFSEITSAICDLSSTTFVISFASVDLGDVACKIMATPPMSQGVNFVKSQLRVITYSGPAGDTLDVYDAYVAKYGIPPTGANIVLTVSPIVESGQQGTAQSIKALVQA